VTTLQDQLRRALGETYTIDREIGRGGMATVFLARDEKHHRNVALKVLDPELGAVLGAERFLSEIRVTAALQHPNLLPLFDSGEAGGLLYYVMPYVDGESLRHRLDREKQLPIDEAVHIATAVANALDYAHAHGVIHRDLKPENILLQHGQPVVADFGIALAVRNAGGARVTQTGLSLGTPQYMSPEQATGDRAIDGRTDIYSLAAVLYEMLAGEPPHTGTSAQAIISKLMTTEPRPVRTLRPAVAPNVAMAVERALAKLPADRFASPKAFAEALANPNFMTHATSFASSVPSYRTSRETWMLRALSVVLLVAALWGWLRPATPQPVVRYVLALDSSEALVTTQPSGRIALSPNGSMLVYVGGPRKGLMLLRRDQLHATMLPGTDSAGGPYFSPDSKRIAFRQRSQRLMIASLDGSPPILVTDRLIGLRGLTWDADDFIYADGLEPGRLVRVTARADSKPEWVGQLDTAAREVDQIFPQILPDKSVLYTTQRRSLRADAFAIAWLDPKSGKSKVVVERANRAQFVEPNYLLYVTNDGNLMVSRFDLSRHKVTGDPSLVAGGLSSGGAGRDFTASRTGALVYVGGASGADPEAIWVGRDGAVQRVDSEWHVPNLGDVAISPDGSRLAVSTGASLSVASSDILVKRFSAAPPSKLTLEGGINRFPVWTRDGKSVVYAMSSGDSSSVVERSVDGGAPPVVRFKVRGGIGPLTLTPSGDRVVYATGLSAGSRLYVRGGGDTVSTRVIPGEETQRAPALSPDGKWLAYTMGDANNQRIYVSPFPNSSTAKQLVVDRDAADPVWSNRGTELFYRERGTQRIVAVPVTTTAVLSFGTPKPLFDVRSVGALTGRYALSRDDSRFLMMRSVGGPASERLTIVQNWTRDLPKPGRK
jgi:eukaryotic-like serine/threonine-protein kinase